MTADTDLTVVPDCEGREIYYDLSELFVPPRGKTKFYGIARVVAEVAFEMHRLDKGVRFVVYDEGASQFFEIKPHFGKSANNGVVATGIPAKAVPFRLKKHRPERARARRAISQLVNMGLRFANRSRYERLRKLAQPVNLMDGYLFSAARPKLIVEFAKHLERTRSAVKLHILLHDCIPLHEFHLNEQAYSKDFQADNCALIPKISHLISNSYFTETDLVAKSGEGQLPPLPISRSVVQLAHESRPDGEIARVCLPQRPYVIGVGIEPGRKNLDVVLAAQRVMIARGSTPPLMVIAGANRRRAMGAFLKRPENASLRPYLLLIDNPSQADLIELYKNALAAVVPSKLEGWGLPLGEALWWGTPAIASPLSSLPEVGRDLAVYFDPDSPDELAALFEKLENDKTYRDQLVARIAAARPSLRSWRDVAVGFLETLPRE